MGPGISVAQKPEVTLRYAGDLPIGNWLSRAQEFFAKRADVLSKGRVKVEVYPAGQLFTAKDYPSAVPGGAVEMAQCALAQWSGLVPLITVLDLPLFFDGLPHIYRVLDSENGEVLKKEFEKTGVKQLFWMQDTSLAFISKVPLKNLEDWRGKRIRAYSEITSHTIKSLGAAPSFLGGGEVYMALQRGTVEGAITGINATYDRKFFEVTKYVTEPGISFAVYGVVINLKKWNDLPKDLQEALMAAGKETQEWGRKEVQKVETELLEELKKKGMDVYSLPKAEKERWRTACKPVYDLVTGKTGEQGRKMLDLADKMR
jgi:tripartite ATP-independent transporter DctP family solute receptor